MSATSTKPIAYSTHLQYEKLTASLKEPKLTCSVLISAHHERHQLSTLKIRGASGAKVWTLQAGRIVQLVDTSSPRN